VEDAGLAGRNALLAGRELDFVAALRGTQPRGLRRTGRANPDENLQTVADRTVEHAVTDPVDVAQHDAMHPQCFARADHDTPGSRFQPHHIQRRTGGDAEPTPLSDREMDNAVVATDRATA